MKFTTGQKFQYKNNSKITYRVSKVFGDGAILAKDEEGDEFSFEVSEFDQLKKVK